MKKIKRPRLGELVFVTKHDRKDLQQRWRVGHVVELVETVKGVRVKLSNSISKWSHVYRGTPDEMNGILFNGKYIPGAYQPENEQEVDLIKKCGCSRVGIVTKDQDTVLVDGINYTRTGEKTFREVVL